MNTILMCEPKYYKIEYEINPWMNKKNLVDSGRALEQWNKLYDILTNKFFCDIKKLEPKEGLPDLTFVANAGLVYKNIFIPSNFLYKGRRPESSYVHEYFASEGFKIRKISLDQYFEWEGDVLTAGDILFGGYPFRSEFAAYKSIERKIRHQIIPLKLVNPWFYHLDICFCPLNSDMLLYYPEAFSPDSISTITKYFSTRLVVDSDEALRFACNSIVIKDKIVIPIDCPKTKYMLEKEGFSVYEIDISEFIKAGGGPKCVILSIN